MRVPLASLLLGCGVRGPPCVRMAASSGDNRVFKLRIDLGDGKAGNLKFKPLLPDSDAVIVKYPVPFGLNVEQDARGLAVCTKSGTGGERPGDILRYSTAYNIGLPEDDGLVGSVSSISGSLSWQVYLFDVGKAKSFQEVVEALTSNTQERTSSVTLVFERPR